MRGTIVKISEEGVFFKENNATVPDNIMGVGYSTKPFLACSRYDWCPTFDSRFKNYQTDIIAWSEAEKNRRVLKVGDKYIFPSNGAMNRFCLMIDEDIPAQWIYLNDTVEGIEKEGKIFNLRLR